MSDKSVTVKQSVIRCKTLYVGADVFRGLRALSMRSIDPLCDCADALGDQMLREMLSANPEVKARQDAIETFFKELNAKKPVERVAPALAPDTPPDEKNSLQDKFRAAMEQS